MLRYVSSIPMVMRVFIMNGCWILSNAFSASVEMIMWFLSFLLLMWYITLIDLQMLNHPCDPVVNLTWSWYMILLIYCWIWFANILLRIFCIYIHQRYWPMREARVYIGEKTVSSTSGAAKTGQLLHVKNEIRTLPHTIYKNKLQMV